MLILFDNNVPRGLARTLSAHTVVEARARCWHTFNNGDLLQAAEDAATPGTYTEVELPID